MIETEKLIAKFKLFWQYPVVTEKTFYTQERNNPLYFGFPWATIIDKKYRPDVIFKLLQSSITTNGSRSYYTCCQHISFRLLIPLFKALNITTVYSPHKIIGEDEINGVMIQPCPLYAVNIEDPRRNEVFRNFDIAQSRPIWYCFAGGYQMDYMSDIRKNILTMKHPTNCVVIHTGQWHFNQDVYHSSQNLQGDLNEDQDHKKKTENYNKILVQSRFSLCPSGSGPNSIRFWESLGAGAIPVLLSDKMTLPIHDDWDNCIVKIKEKDIVKIQEILSKIDLETEKKMRAKCLDMYDYFKKNFRNNKVPRILFTSYICDKNDEIVSTILSKWRILNPSFKVLYFSDNDIKNFFSNSKYEDSYKKLKNGVAIADFFRICYIQTHGGYWFDIDLEPFTVLTPLHGNIHLFDCGFQNISYMFIGGTSNRLYDEVIVNVQKEINDNCEIKKKHIMDITGPRIIQNIVLAKLNIANLDGCLPGSVISKNYLKNTDYEFQYMIQNCTEHKNQIYRVLQQKYNKQNYQFYNYI